MRASAAGICGVLGVVSMAAFARGQAEPSPADLLAMTLKQDDILTMGVAGPILDDARVTDADKALVREAIKSIYEAMAVMKANAAKEGATASTIQADQQKAVQSTMSMMMLLNSRKDLSWVSRRGGDLLKLESEMLRSKPADLASLIQGVVSDETQFKKIQEVIDDFKTDVQAMAAADLDTTQKTAAAQALFDKSFAAIREINPLLSMQQRFDVEWAVVKSIPNIDEQSLRVLGYGCQPGMLHAPEEGTYSLKVEAKEIASVPLKKGDMIGFKKGDKAVTAGAGEKTFDVPAEGAAYWEFVKPKSN